MDQENPLQSASYTLSSALARLGTDLRETAQSAALSSQNREKLFDASTLIHQVFTEIVSSENDRQKELEAVQNEGATLLGEKRYVFEPAPGQGFNEAHVWVEQGGLKDLRVRLICLENYRFRLFWGNCEVGWGLARRFFDE